MPNDQDNQEVIPDAVDDVAPAPPDAVAPASEEGAPRVPACRQAGSRGGEIDAVASVRERILRRFEAWMDEVLAEEQAPQGLDAEILAQLEAGEPADLGAPGQPGGDMFSLWSAMVALAQETKLQGRAFKQLREGLSPVEALPGSIQDVLAATGEATRQVRELQGQQVRQAADEARQQAEAQAVGVMLDIRDRLVRGAQTARLLLDSDGQGKDAADNAARPGWLARLFGARAAEPPGVNPSAAQAARALLDGYMLSLGRLGEALAGMGIAEIPCQGQPFDPRRMTAAAVDRAADVPEGTVVEVYRCGYEWNGRVHRPAEVKVARRPTGGPAAPEASHGGT